MNTQNHELSAEDKKAIDDYSFQVPYDGTQDFYNIEKARHFEAGIRHAREQPLATPLSDELAAALKVVKESTYSWQHGFSDVVDVALAKYEQAKQQIAKEALNPTKP